MRLSEQTRPIVQRYPTIAQILKRVIDIIVAITVLIFLAPVLAIVAVWTRLHSPGPIIYRRRVVGVDGQPFDAFKFRTMVVDADEILRQDPKLLAEFQENDKLRNDPRVIPAARWLRRSSIDELPQLVNVLRNEMSLVGPRAASADTIARYGEYAAKRQSVKPGISGLWQVNGRQDVPFETRIDLDMEYIDDWSLWLDLKILARTIPAVVKMRGAY